MVYGRRPVMLGCSILLLATTIGAGASNSYNTHLACRILQGVAAGATESLLPLIITDMSFIDERGLWFGIYWGTQNVINTVFIVSSSYLVAATSWRWFYWVLAIFAGFGFLLNIFFLAETRYTRSTTSLNGQVVATDEWGVTHILTDAEARERFGTVQETSEGTTTGQKSYMQHLSPNSGRAPHPLRLALNSELKMLQCLSSPAVVWAVLAASISLGVGIAMSLVYGTILTKSFGWSQASVGLVNVGIFPASFAAMFYAGWIGDRMNIWLAKRRDGVHIPEDSLIQLIFPFVVSCIGLVIFAVTAQKPETHSAWGIIMGKQSAVLVNPYIPFLKTNLASPQVGHSSNSASSSSSSQPPISAPRPTPSTLVPPSSSSSASRTSSASAPPKVSSPWSQPTAIWRHS